MNEMLKMTGINYQLIKEDGDGQLYFDFESLESLTDAYFVGELKLLLISDSIVRASVESDEECITILVLTDWTVVKGRYFFNDDFYTTNRICRDDLLALGMSWVD